MSMPGNVARAKLLSLKSYTEAKLFEVEAGITPPEKAFEAIALIAGKFLDESLKEVPI